MGELSQLDTLNGRFVNYCFFIELRHREKAESARQCAAWRGTGRAPFGKGIAQHALDGQGLSASSRGATILNTAAPHRLTPLERGIVSSIAKGCTNEDIARKLFLSEEGVKRHLIKLFRKLGVNNRLELVIHAVGSGFLARSRGNARTSSL